MSLIYPEEEITNDRMKSMISTAFGGTEPVSVTFRELGGAQGYLSNVYRIEITWPAAQASLPSSVIVKKPTQVKLLAAFEQFMDKHPMPKKAQEKEPDLKESFWVVVLHEGHNHECVALEVLSGPDGPKPDAHVPLPYYCKQNGPDDLEGYIVMQDLSVCATLPDNVAGMELPVLEDLFAAFADLHSHCFVCPSFVNHSFKPRVKPLPFLDNPDEIAVQIQIMRASYGDLFNRFSDAQIERLTNTETVKKFAEFNPGRDFFPVLVHGDLWTNNIMVYRGGESSAVDANHNVDKSGAKGRLAAIIDWQLAWVGSPVYDMVSVMCTSVSPELRRAQTDHLLAHYHARLTKNVEEKMNGSGDKVDTADGGKLFTLNELKALYKCFMEYGAFFTLCQVPSMIETLPISKEDRVILAQRVVGFVADTLECVQ